ncbi:MAG: hypothetical protein LLF28_05350 [Nitrospiraceae bacterium]|nr:hypothetical protein [Nitrospiraceae bacterium]
MRKNEIIFYIIGIIISVIFISPPSNLESAVMEDYCQVPPYVIQNVPANVMIIVDNSGSMFNFAYSDGWTTPTVPPYDDNDCTNSSDPCDNFTEPGTYPAYKYYGYFDPDYWYTYSSNRFSPSAPKTGSGLSGARAKLSSEWDGNFLNWLTMRRIDVLRKVMTGGKSTGSGLSTRLLGEVADDPIRGRYKSITTNAGDYTAYTGTKTFTFSTGSSGTSSFTVSGGSSFNVDVNVALPGQTASQVRVEGILQSDVGTKARLGLMFFNTNEGGTVRVSIAGGSLSSTVNEINLTRPSANTPLAEALWTAVGYFAQQSSILGGPGPRYNSADFTINNNNDPFNFGTGGSPSFPSCAKSFVLYITDGEPCSDGNLPASLASYASTKGSPYVCSGSNCPAVGPFAGSTLPACSAGGNVAGVESVALYAHTTDLRNNPTLGVNNMSGTQSLDLYTVLAFGKGSTILRYASINGGFVDVNGNGIPDLQSEWDNNGDNEPDTFYEANDGYELEAQLKNAFSNILSRASSGTAASVLASGEGSGANIVQAIFYPRRRFGNDIINWTGSLQNLWYYIDPMFGSSSIREDTQKETPAMMDLKTDYIANMYFDDTAQQTKVHRCVDTDGDGIGNDANHDGVCDYINPDITLEALSPVWEAGKLLWDRDLSTLPRKIYTNCQISGGTCIGSTKLMYFSTANASILAPYLNLTDLNSLNGTTDEASYLIRYIHGETLSTEDTDGDGISDTTGIDLNSDGIDDYRSRYVLIGGTGKEWKLGDILHSTPKISSWIPPNYYHITYKDTTYGPIGKNPSEDDPVNNTRFTETAKYKSRGMVFSGSNDGMLHAFKMGWLEQTWTGKLKHQTARLKRTCSTTTETTCSSNADCPVGETCPLLGEEMWAFIPKGALPYLQYVANQEYCHIYSVDLTPLIVDASIEKPGTCSIATNYWDCARDVTSWRKILIGGMRLGGACRKTTSTCTDCVKTPILDPADATKGLGYSSYFALDITDENNPILLWEFSDEQLGFSTTGPGIVRISARDAGNNIDSSKNGRWFAVLGSGPTGPIDTATNQFLAKSDQNLRLFILDLKGPGSGAWTLNSNYWIKDTGIANAFSGSLVNSVVDTLQTQTDYQDDVVYLGYVNKCAATNGICVLNTWTDGGVQRLVTKKDINPANWTTSSLISNTGPVTSSIAHLRDTRNGILWLYFGTGRYYYEQNSVTDDADGRRHLFGVKESCYSLAGGFNSACGASNHLNFCTAPCSNAACTAPLSCSDLQNVTDIANVPSKTTANSSSFYGWYIGIKGTGNYTLNENGTLVTRAYKAERVITDPLASTTGCVYFTNYKPYADDCSIGGKSNIAVLEYDTGGNPLCQGVILLQVSTGSIEQLGIPSGTGDTRFTEYVEGVPPPGQGISVIGSPPAMKRTIHIKKK